jgi:hypothetical protein
MDNFYRSSRYITLAQGTRSDGSGDIRLVYDTTDNVVIVKTDEGDTIILAYITDIIGGAGVSGFSGYSGTSGFSGIDGITGSSGFSGYSGVSGFSGDNGASGYSGVSGFSGYSGVSGFSGADGIIGTSGYSGYSGTSGFSGVSGYSGADGAAGTSGYSGYSGVSGFSGYSGVSGFSGAAGTSGYSGYSGNTSNKLSSIYSSLGGTLKAEPFWGTMDDVSGTLTLTDGQLRMFAVWLDTAQTITGVAYVMQTAGSFTGDNNNKIGLYTYSGGTLTRVAQTANDANIWKATANTLAKAAFTGTYSASAGIYFIGFLGNWTAAPTPPVIYTAPALAFNAIALTQDFTNSGKLNSLLAAQTDLPSSQASSGLTASTTMPYLALY